MIRARPSIRDLARQLDLSVCTVSRILNDRMGDAKYAATTIARVRAAAAAVGYQPDAIARSLVSGRTRTVGLCLADIANPHFATFAAGFERRAAAHGRTTFICNTGEDPETEVRVVDSLLARRPDALVIAPAPGSRAAPTLAAARACGCRVVLFDRELPGLRAPLVTADNADAMAVLTARCLALGHRRVGVIAGDRRDSSLAQRLAGVRQAARAAGLPAAAVVVAGDDDGTSVAAGAQALACLWRQTPPPTLVLALANVLAIGALQAARAAGLRPGTAALSFACFDEFPGSDLLEPPVSLAAQPVATLAESCADLACGDAPLRPGARRFPATITWRGSVVPPA